MGRAKGWIAAGLLALACAQAQADPAPPRDPDDLLVFVGEKESVVEFEPQLPPNVLLMDGAFKARFRVVQVLHGRYDGERIEFEAYDHSAEPGFSFFPHSLLFLAPDGERYVQVKYQFYPVFRTVAGEWAGCGPLSARERKERRGIAPARPMSFGDDAYVPLDVSWTPVLSQKQFRRSDFRIEGRRAYCLRGASAQALFEVKKRGVLRDDGWFADEPRTPAR